MPKTVCKPSNMMANIKSWNAVELNLGTKKRLTGLPEPGWTCIHNNSTAIIMSNTPVPSPSTPPAWATCLCLDNTCFVPPEQA